MNSILRIYVPSILNVAAHYTEVLTVTIDLTPDISKQPTLHDHVYYFLGLRVHVNKSCEIYYSFDNR